MLVNHVALRSPAAAADRPRPAVPGRGAWLSGVL